MVSLSTPVTGTGSVPPSLDMVPVPQYLHDAIVPHTKPQPPHILNSLALMVKTLNYGRRPLIDTFVYSLWILVIV
jgi:hypothetical protein